MYDDTMKPSIKPMHPTLVPSGNRTFSKWQLACWPNKSIFRANKTHENATITSYVAGHGKPFSDGDFIKQCLTEVTGIMFLFSK